MSDWPPLAWIIECELNKENIAVFHGNNVECSDEWFCEAVWDGDFKGGNFDDTDIIAGSGVRIREQQLTIVSSGSNTDRLHSFTIKGKTFVSNSLNCLLSWTDSQPLFDYHGYCKDFENYRYALLGKNSIDFPSTKGVIKLTYYANLIWDGNILKEIQKPGKDREFNNYQEYYQFLQNSLKSIAENANNKNRQKIYKMLCPLSNGYDSPTIAAIAVKVGRLEAFTFSKDRSGEDDSGAEVADYLGITCHDVNRDDWQNTEFPEIPFIACSCSIGDLAFKAAEHHLENSLVLSGFGGDSLWDRDIEFSNSMEIGSGAMLSLTEYRLRVGFILCPVPLWGVRQGDDIVKISHAEEMKNWDIGGYYNRPICRRIVEEAGVPREAFGIDKRGVSVVPSARRDYLTPGSRHDYYKWLGDQKSTFRKLGIKPPSRKVAQYVDDLLAFVTNFFNFIYANTHRRGLRKLRKPLKQLLDKLSAPQYHHKYIIHWAIDRANQVYKSK